MTVPCVTCFGVTQVRLQLLFVLLLSRGLDVFLPCHSSSILPCFPQSG